MDEFTRHCLELLSPLGHVRAKRMFGGQGLYVDDIFIAIIAYEQLYLKADEETRPKFLAAACEPFRYSKSQEESVSLSYYQPPEEALESPALMQPWARMALAAAVRAKAKKSVKRPPASRKKASPKSA